jgi:D-sedoheptulose 7-phosphate isomerase
VDLKNAALKSVVSEVRKEEPLEFTPDTYLQSLVEVLQNLPVPIIDEIVERLCHAFQQDCAVYVFGNGGSAALASHIACDLGKGTTVAGRRPFRVLSLTDNVSLITAWANDTSYDNIFAAQLSPFIQAGDIAFAVSGSGNSPNVLNGLRVAREAGASTIGITGFQGGKMKALCDCCLVVPSDNMQQIEDSHLSIMHAVFLGFRQAITNVTFARATAI